MPISPQRIIISAKDELIAELVVTGILQLDRKHPCELGGHHQGAEPVVEALARIECCRSRSWQQQDFIAWFGWGARAYRVAIVIDVSINNRL